LEQKTDENQPFVFFSTFCISCYPVAVSGGGYRPLTSNKLLSTFTTILQHMNAKKPVVVFLTMLEVIFLIIALS